MQPQRPNPIVFLIVVLLMVGAVLAFGWACIEAAIWLGTHNQPHC